MSFEDELTALVGDNLFDFLLKDDVPCPEIPEWENNLLEDCSLTEAEILDKDMDDLITSVLYPLEGEPDMLQSYFLSENQHLSRSPGRDFAVSPQDSDSVQIDHNYSLPLDVSVMESMRSDMTEGVTSIELGKWRGLEGANMAREQSSSFPTAVAMDAGAIVQDEEYLVDELHQWQSAQDDHHREMDLENRSQLEQTSVTQSTAGNAAEKTSAMVMVLSINLTFSSSLCLLQSVETETEFRVVPQQICEFPNQAAPEVGENTVLEGFSPEPEDLFLLGSLSQSQEE